MLAKIGISEHLIKNKNRLKSVAFQVNPLDIESYLKKVLPYRANSNAPKADADTLERILLLRKGDLGRSIPESKAIFVTHNWNYSTLSRKYCVDHLDYSWQTAPPITTLGVLTRLAWLGSANSKDPMVLSKDLAAKSYQAALPDKRWLNKFWQTLEKSNPELIDQNCSDSLYLLDVRERAENITMGNSSLIGNLEIPEILQDLKEKAKKDKNKMDDEKNRLSEQENHAKARQVKHELDMRARHKADVLAKVEGQKLIGKKLAEQAAIESKKNTIEQIESIVERSAIEDAAKYARALALVIVAIICMLYFFGLMKFVPDEYHKLTIFMNWFVGGVGLLQILSMFIGLDWLRKISLREFVQKKLEQTLKKRYRGKLLGQKGNNSKTSRDRHV